MVSAFDLLGLPLLNFFFLIIALMKKATTQSLPNFRLDSLSLALGIFFLGLVYNKSYFLPTCYKGMALCVELQFLLH